MLDLTRQKHMDPQASATRTAADDLQPLWPLSITLFVAQVAGVGLCWWIGKYPSWLDNVWVGGALASFPGYLLGLGVQRRFGPEGMREQRTMVRRLGAAALLLSVAVLSMVLFGSP